MSNRIETLWAYMVVDENGDEGIFARKVGDSWMPLVMGCEENMRKMLPKVIGVAKEMNKGMRLVKFIQRVDMEEFGNDPHPNH